MAYAKTYVYNNALTPEQNTLCAHLYSMKVSVMADALALQFSEPNNDLLTFEERVRNIIDSEWSLRDSRKFNKVLKNADLKYPMADFDSSIYDADRQLDTTTIERLQTCGFIDEKRNLLISGKTGAGKTYLGCAICVAACHQYRTVKYKRANRLIEEFDRVRAQDGYLAFLDELISYDLLVIDDFGLMPLDLDRCRDLFELIESREGFKSTMILSQVPFDNWYDLFGEKTYADACMRRIFSKAYRLDMNGRDMSQGI